MPVYRRVRERSSTFCCRRNRDLFQTVSSICSLQRCLSSLPLSWHRLSRLICGCLRARVSKPLQCLRLDVPSLRCDTKRACLCKLRHSPASRPILTVLA